MRGWRQKKNDDFEWHKYVRTTIKLRREQRRETVEQVKKSAATGAKSAVRRTGNFIHDSAISLADWSVVIAGASGRALLKGTSKTAQWISQGFAWSGRRLAAFGAAVVPIVGKIWSVTTGLIVRGVAPIMAVLARPMIRTPLGLIGVLALTAAIWRWFGVGMGPQVRAALMISATALVLSYGPRLFRALFVSPPFWLSSLLVRLSSLRPAWLARAWHNLLGWRPLARLPKMPAGIMRGAMAATVVLAIGGLGWMGLAAVPSAPAMPSFPSFSFSKFTANIPLIGTPEPITGRARALTGDILRIARKPIRLAGIEAPELQQRCKKDRRRRKWRCGRVSRQVLARLIRRRTLRCEPSGTDDVGRITATCYVGKLNINAAMVAKGYAFAGSGLLASYTDEEARARKAKRGIWRGKSLRPAAYRAQKWDEAKRRAPDGCPIKGDVTRAGKVYVLPWAGNYRRVRITKSRGERWFCSESAARAAGWLGAGHS